MKDILKNLQANLNKSRETNIVPGAAIAVYQDGQLFEAASGIVSNLSQVAVTDDSLFNIGSISKLFTATQILQLTEQKLLSLDDPVARYLPEFDHQSKTITLAQLITHTSGLAGDFFKDTGPGDDCLLRYAKDCSDLPMAHPVGEAFSYCNTGYSLLGGVIQKITGQTWEKSVEDMILKPLGIKKYALLPEQALPHRASVGHYQDPVTGALSVMPLGFRSMGPGGSRLMLSPKELLVFARSFFPNMRGNSDQNLLLPGTIDDMLKPVIDLSFTSNVKAWGLGWTRFDWSGQNVPGHDGGTAGMLSQLRVVPEKNMAVALMSNGPGGGKIFRDIAGPLMTELADVTIPSPPIASGNLSFDLMAYAGCYRRYGMQVEINVTGNDMTAVISSRDGEINVPEPLTVNLSPITKEIFLAHIPGVAVPTELNFHTFDQDGKPQYLYSMFRAMKRVSLGNS